MPAPSATSAPPPWRLLLLVGAFASLIVGIAAGLARLGWAVPGSALAGQHGPLMVSGFFGTVISLERAVASGRRWAYGAPAASALSALAIVMAWPPALAPLFALAAGVIMLFASIAVYRRQAELFALTLALGAACWPLASLAWFFTAPIHRLVPWWIAFLVLTIAGERLELSRVLPPSAAGRRVFGALMVLLLAGASTLVWSAPAGTTMLGAALVGFALWLLRQDIARRTVRTNGLPRFIAVCLLTGYAWLGVGGAAILADRGLGSGGEAYDAALHAVLLGFVLSMVFGHAPIIIPAVLRVAVPYRSYFYGPLALLHGSLMVRLAGDWMLGANWRAWGGALNACAIAAFLLGTLASVLRGKGKNTQRLPAAPQQGTP